MKVKGRVGVADGDNRYTYTKIATVEDLFGIAASIIESRMIRADSFTSPEDSRRFLTLRIGTLERETFCCLFLDNRHRLIQFERLFEGTIDGASVYPREVVKRALHYNAAAVIMAHNHPSGVADPSPADRNITCRLRDALALVDVRVLDHIVVAGTETMSFAERGLL